MIDRLSHYIALGSTFIPCPKNYNQTRLGLKFQIKRKPYTKRILITKENIKLSPVTDRDTATIQSVTSAFIFRVIGRLPVASIGKYQHWSSASPLLDLAILSCSSIGTILHRQLPYRLATIAQSTDLRFINSIYVPRDTCQKTVSTVLSHGQDQCSPWEDYEFSATT